MQIKIISSLLALVGLVVVLSIVFFYANEDLTGEAVNQVTKSYLKQSAGRDGEALAEADQVSLRNKELTWTEFANTDCPGNDLNEHCNGGDIESCKKLCLSIEECTAFNNGGWLKRRGCTQKKAPCDNCGINLWVVENKPVPDAPPVPWKSIPPIWPHPSNFTHGSMRMSVNSALTFVVKNSSPDISNALHRFRSRAFPNDACSTSTPSKFSLGMVQCDVLNPRAKLNLDTDESYVLLVPNPEGVISLSAETQFGLYHGLESLSQMIYFDFDDMQYYIDDAPWAISDAPRFKHRELLIDTARHFLPLPTIRATIDAMTYSKINVMHWHMVDSQSFPLISPSRPLLAKMGAFSPVERYTIKDVGHIVEYARERGVRVIVELDTPGHAAAWCKGYPEICPSVDCPMPLNPANNVTFDVISDVIGDITSGHHRDGPVFDDYVHVGGDEVDSGCWGSTPSISSWMQAQGFDHGAANRYFMRRVHEIVHSYGKKVMAWEETWYNCGKSLDPSTVIQIWLNKETAKSVVAAGYSIVFSPYPTWYFDYLDVNWRRMYALEPCDGISDDDCAKYVLGGGGESWGEQVDWSNFEATVWPRLAAIGERLWSPRHIVDAEKAEPRIMEFKCLLNRRGVAAAHVGNPNARSGPPVSQGCYYYSPDRPKSR